MKKRSPLIITSCILSLVIIIIAVYIRFTDAQKIKASLSVSGGQNNINSVDSTNYTYVDSPNVNKTDLVSQELFTQYISLKQSGNLNTETSKALVGNIAAQVQVTPDKVFTVSDLKIISNPTKKDIKDYANTFWSIRLKYKDLFSKNVTLNKDTSDQAVSLFGQSVSMAGGLYIQMANTLAEMPVPDVLVKLHLKLLNNYEVSGLSLSNLSKIDSDPIQTISGLNTFSNYSDYEDTTLRILANYFQASGIIFNSTDPGIGWKSL